MVIVINKLEDIEKIELSEDIPKDYKDEIKRKFIEVYDNISPVESIDEFSLEEYGQIVVLEPSDDIRNLSDIGLDDGGLMECYPEWIEYKMLDQTEVYYICIVRNNENAVVIYTRKDIFDDEVETWLRTESGIE
jgi:hypothetical protein